MACVLPPDREPRLVFFGVGEKPVLISDPGAVAELEPLEDLHATAEYRREAAATLAERALAEARERAGA